MDPPILHSHCLSIREVLRRKNKQTTETKLIKHNREYRETMGGCASYREHWHFPNLLTHPPGSFPECVWAVNMRTWGHEDVCLLWSWERLIRQETEITGRATRAHAARLICSHGDSAGKVGTSNRGTCWVGTCGKGGESLFQNLPSAILHAC